MDVCGIWKIEADNPDDRCQRAPLFHHACAEPGESHNGEGEIIVSQRHNPGHVPAAAEGVDFPDVIVHLCREDFFLPYIFDSAVNFESQRHSWDHKDVGCLSFHGVFKKFFDIHKILLYK